MFAMAKPKKSEKLFLKKVFLAGKVLQKELQGLSIGQLIPLIRGQLGMSQRTLATRAAIQQSSVARIESGRFDPNISTLKKIVEAMGCDLVVTIVPKTDLKTTRENQAKLKAEQKIRYLHGTMSLEKQSPNQKLLKELYDDEVKNLLDSSGSILWDE
jgi:predicted DNA-binding mobile mystery protein A